MLVTSWRQIPGSVEAFARLRSAGIPIRLVTNTTTRTRAALAGILSGRGFDVASEDILTATAAAGAYLRREHPGARVFLLGSGAEELEGVDLVEEGADVIVIGGAAEPGSERPQERFTHERLTAALRMLVDGAAFVAMHRNLSWQSADGLVLDSGAYTVGLERAAGMEATVVGKPAPDFFRAALDDLGLPAARVATVGDDLEADVLGAQAVGMSGILVRTGKFRPEMLEAAAEAPDHVIDSLADLPALLHR